MRPRRRSLFKSLPAIALALFGGACSTSGRDFAKPDTNTLVLGVTTPADVLATYGEPFERSSEPGDVAMIDAFESLQPRPPGLKKAMVKGEIARLRYSFTHAALVSLGDGATARIRLLDVSFWNGKLIAYNFSSSFDRDATDFDDKKVSALVRGRTTVSDVLNEFGAPGGQAIYPSVARQGTRQYAWQYAVAGPRRGQITLKRLELLFGPTDRLDQVYLVTEIRDGTP